MRRDHTTRRLGILGLALLALFALGALMAGMASAEEGVLPPSNFTGKGGKVTHKNLNNEEVSCKEAEGSGKFLTEKEKDQHGEGTVTLKGCTALGLSANTLGDPSGTIKARGLFLVCLTEPKTLLFGVLVQPIETVHGEIPTVKELLLLKGSIIASLTKSGELKGKEFAGQFTENDKHATCEINGTRFTSTFESSIDTKADVDSFQMGEGTIVFEKEVVFMDT